MLRFNKGETCLVWSASNQTQQKTAGGRICGVHLKRKRNEWSNTYEVSDPALMTHVHERRTYEWWELLYVTNRVRDREISTDSKPQSHVTSSRSCSAWTLLPRSTVHQSQLEHVCTRPNLSRETLLVHPRHHELRIQYQGFFKIFYIKIISHSFIPSN